MKFSTEKLTVKSRVFFLIFIMIVFLCGLAVTSYVGLGIVNEGTRTIMDHVTELKQASELQLEIWKMVMPVNDYLITGELEKARNEFDESHKKLSAILESVKRKGDITAREREILAGAEQQLAAVTDYAARIFQIEVKDIVIHKTGSKLMEEMDAKGEQLIGHVGSYNAIMNEQMISAENSAKSAASWVMILVLSITLASIILGLVIGIVIARGVNRTMMGVVTANTGLAEGIQQISSGNQDLSQRTSEQASSLEEIVSTLEQAAAAIDQINKNCQEANDVAENSTSLAVNGGDIIKKAIVAITDINTSSRKISEIISVIDNIAFQTNLLALNAAVEAARAGEAGKGFAVVASEVKNLAQQSGKAAKEITRLINDTVEQIKKGTEVVNISGESLFKIIESVKQVRSYINEIAAASLEQKQGLDQINIAMGDLDQVTQQNSALVEEIATASEEIATQSSSVMDMVETITTGKSSRVSAKEHQH